MQHNDGTVRLSDIAHECGVSTVTVSKVLNPSARSTVRVSPETAKRIHDVAKRLNYHTNLRASSLRNGDSRLIGVLIDSANLEGLARMLVEIEHQASLHNYQLMISGEHDSISRFKDGYQKLHQYGAEGIICISHDYHFGGDELYDFLQADSEHVVLVGRPRIGDFWYVDIDYGACTQAAFEYFIKRGRRRIVGVCFSGQGVELDDYRNTFNRCCERYAGMDGFEAKMVNVNFMVDPKCVHRQLKSLVAEEIIDWKCDAIISQTDFIAGCAIHELQAHGIRVPDDIAIIGHGNDSFDELITPQLATMDDGLARQGRAAFDLIRRQMGQRVDTIAKGKRVLIEPEFVWRSSAG